MPESDLLAEADEKILEKSLTELDTSDKNCFLFVC